jgi:hypothetical protein
MIYLEGGKALVLQLVLTFDVETNNGLISCMSPLDTCFITVVLPRVVKTR